MTMVKHQFIRKKEPSKYFGKEKYCVDEFVTVFKKIKTSSLIPNEGIGYQTVYIVLLAISVVIIKLLLLLFSKGLNGLLGCIKTYCFKAKSKPARERPTSYTPNITNCEDSTLLPSAPPNYDKSLDYISGQQIKKEDEPRICAGLRRLPNYGRSPIQGYGIPGVDDPPHQGNDNDEYDDETQQITGEPTTSSLGVTSFENIGEPQGNTNTFPEENNTFSSSHGEKESTVYENKQSGSQNHNVHKMNIVKTKTNGTISNSFQNDQKITVYHKCHFFH